MTTPSHMDQPLRCWAKIGVEGDRSCPELVQFVHCRNCPTYSAGTRELLSRQPPPDYLEMWSRLLGGRKDGGSEAGQPHVIFRVGQSWLALRATVLREVTAPAVVRLLPHRRSELLLGLSAIRGEIHLCASLHLLLGEAATSFTVPTVRFLVAEHEGRSWVLPVDEMSGVEEFPEERVEPLPATLARTGGVYTRGIVKTSQGSTGVLDEGLLFSALERNIR